MEIFRRLHGTHPVHVTLFIVSGPAGFFQHLRQFRIINLVGIIFPNPPDPELVGCYKKFPVRHPLGDPKAPFTRGRGLHLHHPAFVPVCHQQGLAGSPQSVCINEAADKMHRVPGCPAAFQSYPPQFGSVEDAAAFLWFQIFQMPGIVGAFSQHEAVLVHDAVIAVNVCISVSRFRNLPQGLCPFPVRVIIPGSPFRSHQAGIVITGIFRQIIPGNGGRVHLAHSPGGMILGRNINDTGIAGKRIVGMGYKSAAVRGSSFRHNRCGTGVRRRNKTASQNSCQHCRDKNCFPNHKFLRSTAANRRRKIEKKIYANLPDVIHGCYAIIINYTTTIIPRLPA